MSLSIRFRHRLSTDKNWISSNQILWMGRDDYLLKNLTDLIYFRRGLLLLLWGWSTSRTHQSASNCISSCQGAIITIQGSSLPSGPTRRPGQPTTLHPSLQSTTISPALNQFLSLPLLTTKRPRKLRLPGEAVQKNVLEEFGPFESHFIAPPQLNAGALPLAVNDNLPLFPPFNNPALLTDDEDDEDESS